MMTNLERWLFTKEELFDEMVNAEADHGETKSRLAELEGAAVELLKATHIGDQNFVGLLNSQHAEPIRNAINKIERIMKQETCDE